MTDSRDLIGLSSTYLRAGTSSFTEFVRLIAPETLPGARLAAGGPATGASPGGASHLTAQATTIVALCYDGGVVMAGDRRATAGNMIAQNDIQKVFAADEHSLIGIAGAAGVGIELIGLFQLELEHYEKIEGAPLSTIGKANRLSTILRQNLGLAMQGLAVVPLFAGWDDTESRGRIFSYDPVGGRYEERAYHAIGSGSIFARGSIKKLYRGDFSADQAVIAALQGLYDAAEDDSATGGPDLARRIYPVVWTASADGAERVGDDRIGEFVDQIVTARRSRPDGPEAPVV
ncbi:proteasome subunit beta [Microlunatus sp. Gsoil 973]|jgi:proteasome beta subunit|uniref:proteasome subunit beta n=1 Tax=Microlunatus sp. Gsoil 973 TaxID=2672569 RepID=UPI0012B4E874|nr:proteasome subunit beta [Microlunatus sp. Gsoil 973]QGN32412.1 proteasome subunit beta [Microlunatus sp. Gsoil 973]